ncbi:hypothetical protein [Rothia terrae]|uniref:Uncharacterized protein n=1 Tax=Rothia terrae TaxID=396015 RepID=A0A7H2BD04_9MICC|nr:hypothetical protein [Rothia terrae]QNV37550.1 hypothetical protein IDM49_10100 [Rothia terrae]
MLLSSFDADRLSRAYTPVFRLVSAAPQQLTAQLWEVFNAGVYVGMVQQEIIDQQALEERAEQIAQVECETVPVFVADPQNLIPGFDDVKKVTA